MPPVLVDDNTDKGGLGYKLKVSEEKLELSSVSKCHEYAPRMAGTAYSRENPCNRRSIGLPVRRRAMASNTQRSTNALLVLALVANLRLRNKIMVYTF